MAAEITDRDPRLDMGNEIQRDIRPIVRKPGSGLPSWVLVVAALLMGALLFGVLDGRRRGASAPAVSRPSDEAAISPAPPPLYLPPPSPPEPPIAMNLPSESVTGPPPKNVEARPPAPPVSFSQPVFTAQPSSPAPPTPTPPRSTAGPALVLDTSRSASSASGSDSSAAPEGAASGSTTNRAYAGVFANRSTTVAQGTLIPAVLETAYDSSRPGFARALVQRDVRGFDGSRVLIPRGSRLIGEYGSDAKQGQRRAVVAWTRLIRPDGVTIALASPAADPLGRGGLNAKVDTHFFERFAGSILQSALDVGVNLASRSADSSVVVALPNSFQGSMPTATRSADIAPTLKVPQGTSVSVFVARDLDFADVESSR